MRIMTVSQTLGELQFRIKETDNEIKGGYHVRRHLAGYLVSLF